MQDPLVPLIDYCVSHGWPNPRGLLYGLGMVLVGQAVVLLYYFIRRNILPSTTIQVKPPPPSTLAEDLWEHVSAPESFFMVYGYLTVVWMFRLMPASYYDIESRVNWLNVLAQFIVVDFFIFVDHLVEHSWPALYKRSHKRHHRFINPKLYNAFNGSPPDTVTLILIPLLVTHHICNWCHCWDFIAFGTLYASQFTLIHCEFSHPWDPLLRLFGVGTAADHNVHHILFVYNYGHFFMWWDKLYGTYRAPEEVRQCRVSHMAEQKAK